MDEDTIKIAKIEVDIAHILAAVLEVKTDLREMKESHTANERRIAALEHDKKTVIAIISCALVVVYEIGKEWVSKHI